MVCIHTYGQYIHTRPPVGRSPRIAHITSLIDCCPSLSLAPSELPSSSTGVVQRNMATPVPIHVHIGRGEPLWRRTVGQRYDSENALQTN